MKKKTCYIILSILTLAVFLLNANHITQQGIYDVYFKPLSDGILSGSGYSDFSGAPRFYPLWGYPALIALSSVLPFRTEYLLGAIQAILSVIGIFYFYKIFQIEQKNFHFFLLIPFLALLSVKWPDAIVGFLTLPFIYYSINYYRSGLIKDLALSALFFALIGNFRSEYLFLPIFSLAFCLLPSERIIKLRIIKHSLVIFVAVIIALAPWAIRSYIANGSFIFTATNGGAVSYISLGQLTGNKWHISPLDSTSFGFACRKGFSDPYSFSADTMFKSEYKRLVLGDKMEFSKKCAYNLAKAFIGGVYVGEYANIVIGKGEREKIDEQINKSGGTFKQIGAALQAPNGAGYFILLEKALRAFFIIFTALCLIYFFIKIFYKTNYKSLIIYFPIVSLVIYRLITIALIQWEYRHISAIYLLLLGMLLKDFDKEKIKTLIAKILSPLRLSGKE